MSIAQAAEPQRSGGVRRTAAQVRVLDAALRLFARYGVSGASLQMIADEIGVTKAAVYHQFRTKNEIVVAVMERELDELELTLGAAEEEPSPARARELALTSVVDFAVRHRRYWNVLQNDPVIVRVMAHHTRFNQLIARIYDVLLGPHADPVPVALMAGAIGGALAHPLVHPLLDGVDDERIGLELERLARRILQLPDLASQRAAGSLTAQPSTGGAG